MNDTDASFWHPWLRINRLLCAMLHERWSADAWPQVKAEFKKALALKSQIRRAGWFNLSSRTDGRRGLVYHAAGTNSIYTTNLLKRFFRDIHMATQHRMASPEEIYQVDRVILGARSA